MALARFISDPTATATLPAAAGVPTLAPVASGTGANGAAAQAALMPTSHLPRADPERSPSGPWAWMAVGLGLLVIVASGILLFLLFSGIGDRAPSPSASVTPAPQIVRTPSLIGRSEVEAGRIAERRGLVLETDYVESDEDPGLVVGQLPDPGVEVPAGTSVQITVATRVETVVVPDLHGIREATAVAQLEAAGLQSGERSTAADALPAGYLVSTEPRAGDSVTRGSVVDYVVSEGRSTSTRSPGRTFGPTGTRVPDAPAATAGSPAASARSPAASAGSTVAPAASAAPSAGSPVASAESTAAPGRSAAASAVPSAPSTPPPEDLEVMALESPASGASNDPSPFPSDQVAMVGDFLCLDLATARAHIEAAGLLIGVTIPSDVEPLDSWIVHGQLPKAGESVPVGTNVDLVLMDPLEPCPAG
jgi:serine/threonine-protein kinase